MPVAEQEGMPGLWAKGWQVQAFDLSQGSIDMAKEITKNPNVNFKVMDLRDLPQMTTWEGQFDLITNFFTSIGYFAALDHQRSIIRGFQHCLRPGGSLLIDYLNARQVKSKLVDHEMVYREGIEFKIHRRIREGWIDKSIQFNYQDEPHHHVESVQLLDLDDFDAVLRIRFQITQVWGDYSLSPWHSHSPRCMLLAKKITYADVMILTTFVFLTTLMGDGASSGWGRRDSTILGSSFRLAVLSSLACASYIWSLSRSRQQILRDYLSCRISIAGTARYLSKGIEHGHFHGHNHGEHCNEQFGWESFHGQL